MPIKPITFGDSDGCAALRNLGPWVRSLMHSWLAAADLALPMFL